jgi:hypothetical protein
MSSLHAYYLISTRAPWITQNEQRFVASEIPHELDAQMAVH